jgi:hypothetical protein
MKKPVYITTIKLHIDWEPEVIVTTRPFEEHETSHILNNIAFFKNQNPDWEGKPCDLLDYAILTPFKSICVECVQINIELPI